MYFIEARTARGWAVWHHDAPLRDPERYAAKVLKNKGVELRITDACGGCGECRQCLL